MITTENGNNNNENKFIINNKNKALQNIFMLNKR